MNFNFVKSSCVALSSITALSACGAKKIIENTRPNIIFILTDDQRANTLGYAGNKIIQTPEMDKLAGQGCYFQNAFVSTPICNASRASILTGLYERTHGYTLLTKPLKEEYKQISYPNLLSQNGYYTGFFGKVGVEMDDVKSLADTVDDYDRKMKPGRVGYFYKAIGEDTVHLTRYTGYQAQQFIKNAPKDKPFCLSLSFSAPHAHDISREQYYWQPKSDSLYADVVIPSPLISDDKYFEALPKEVQEGYNRIRWTWRFDTPEKYQRSVKGYYRMITEVDDEIGEIRKLLTENGIADNTVIILMGDNGYFLGERQLADKWLMYDQSLRVPLIIYDPRVKKHRDVSDMVLNLDIPETILDLANVEIPQQYEGNSLVPYLKTGKSKQAHNEILVEHLLDKLPGIPPSEGIRTNDWKYFRYRSIEAPEELYDLKKDPLETVNLATDPAYADKLKEMRASCEKLILRYESEGKKMESEIKTE